MSCKQNCDFYGALNCVAGPFNPGYLPDYSYCGGTYPPWRPCPPWCDCGLPVPEYARQHATVQPVSTFRMCGPCKSDADSDLVLAPATMNWNLFYADRSGIRILHSGTYLAIYTVDLPPQQTADTEFSLRLNGNEIVGSRHRFACAACANSTGVSAQAIVQASPNSLLTLHSDASLNLACDADNLFTLTLLKL